VKLVKKQFDEAHVHHPKASRATSSELYVVGLDFRGRRS